MKKQLRWNSQEHGDKRAMRSGTGMNNVLVESTCNGVVRIRRKKVSQKGELGITSRVEVALKGLGDSAPK